MFAAIKGYTGKVAVCDRIEIENSLSKRLTTVHLLTVIQSISALPLTN